MIIVVIGVVVFGYVGEVVVLVFLFLFVEVFEDWVMDWVKEGLCVLLLLILEIVCVLCLNGDVMIFVVEVCEFDIFVVGVGEWIVMDGVVVEGCFGIDMFVVMGELILVEVGLGYVVFVGLVNGVVMLWIEVIVDGCDNFFI